MEPRDPDFDQKMTQVLNVYKEVELIRQMGKDTPPVTVLSYDEKPGIQAVSKKFPTFLRFQANIHVLQGIMNISAMELLSGIDFLNGQVHGMVAD